MAVGDAAAASPSLLQWRCNWTPGLAAAYMDWIHTAWRSSQAPLPCGRPSLSPM
ncbi:hypothetical protein JKF63_01713 [Porcisia hertigi]|uniref:Uncharacterized protein n=1 Tax=Porcisia hertigi TaxID=2761500 RepID=A0A836L0C4_9TRYP|nr:hypothetical protein JKF63_01713 [Porcisia hertigi]